MKQLKELRLNHCRQFSCIAVLSMLQQLSSLKSVQLRDYHIRQMRDVKMAAITHIESLDIRNALYSFMYDLKKFICRFPQLRSLFMRDITEEHTEGGRGMLFSKMIQSFSERLPVLEFLDLGDSPDSFSGNFPALHSIAANRIDWIPKSMTLKCLYLDAESIDELRREFPNEIEKIVVCGKWTTERLLTFLQTFKNLKVLCCHLFEFGDSHGREIAPMIEKIATTSSIQTLVISKPMNELLRDELVTLRQSFPRLNILVELLSQVDLERSNAPEAYDTQYLYEFLIHPAW
jgi:hypothetical protein